ncbi:MAG TPA: L,D-transpeptidase family protein [Gaiellaceae bacterium]|nr:L,D-transpeptidase family protein [Gaiellaceae bacterium]
MTARRYRSRRAGPILGVALVLVTLAFVAVGAAARAQEVGEAPRKAVVADGVSVAGVQLGGLTRARALERLRRSFNRPVALSFRGTSWRFAPATLGASADLDAAVRAALAAPEGSSVRLDVAVGQKRLQRWANRLARDFDRNPVNARIVLERTRPQATPASLGRKLYTSSLRTAVTSELRANDRGPLTLPVRIVKPRVTRAKLGPAVVILRTSNRLVYYRGVGKKGMRVRKRFGVATGQAAYPTPLGSFTIVDKQLNPWWYPPDSDWAAGAQPVPPGPGNPLGTRWMGLSEPLIGIHGTPDAASIGYSASHGCVRMLVPEAEWLFERVTEGTPVFILDA